jgi:hypothetical protein
MAKHTVVTMPGDGIGNQVLPEALRILKAVKFDAEYVHADIGWDCWRREGNALPQRTVDLLAKHKLGLFGAITSKPKKQAEAGSGGFVHSTPAYHLCADCHPQRRAQDLQSWAKKYGATGPSPSAKSDANGLNLECVARAARTCLGVLPKYDNFDEGFLDAATRDVAGRSSADSPRMFCARPPE